ncbi:MAG: metal ABC transporter permease [Hydrogenobacter thermophilus]|uniref:metal ABC transporter permease n=1 Tax=Hydrogenobacter thermophilus TaxID=940 RepID=UPI001C73E66D|nr:metal ABC transporter permease [Hydrogenobacter thermophilus]QWK19457.1 MAG: metal ABC transporter permease [Hydrogenobacter thermophilus]
MLLLEYAFLWKGLVGGLLISASSSLVGVFLLMKRLSLLGAGLSHAAFGGIALAILFNTDPTLFTLLYTVFSGLLLQFLIEKRGLPADTVISLFFSLGVALAILVLSITQNLGSNVYSYLFGSVLTVSDRELYSALATSLLTFLFVLAYYRKLLLISFNEELATLRGVKVSLLNYLLISIASANIVFAIKAVGLILASSFIAIPPMSALLVASSFFSTLALSLFLSLSATLLGMLLSFELDAPPSATIILCMVFIFLILTLWKGITLLKRRLSQTS